MLGMLTDIGLGILGATGQAQTNRANRDIARDQMNFQERMSNTAVQRSVEDYRKAGLNPALAYERSASTPGGASTIIGDATGAGISSGLRSREARIAMAQAAADLKVKANQARLLEKEGNLKTVQTTEADRQYRFNLTQQPFTAQLERAQAALALSALPEAESTAEFYKRMIKGVGPGVTTAKTLAEILKLISGQPAPNIQIHRK